MAPELLREDYSPSGAVSDGDEDEWVDSPAIDCWAAGVSIAEWVSGEQWMVTGGEAPELNDPTAVAGALKACEEWCEGVGSARVRRAAVANGWSQEDTEGVVDLVAGLTRWKAEDRLSAQQGLNSRFFLAFKK